MEFSSEKSYNLDQINFFNPVFANALENADGIINYILQSKENHINPETVLEVVKKMLENLIIGEISITELKNIFHSAKITPILHSEELKDMQPEIDIEAIMCYIALKFIKNLTVGENLSYFYNRIFRNKISICEITKIVKATENKALQSYRISGLHIFSKCKKDTIEQFRYWCQRNTFEYYPVNAVMYNYVFKAALKSDAFKNTFINLLNQLINLKDFISLIKGRTFLIDIFPGSYGITTHGLYIFIKQFCTGNKNIDEAASFITFIHELGHLIPRLQCSNYGEVIQKRTPPNSLRKERNNKNEGEKKSEGPDFETVPSIKKMKNDKGEGGFDLEETIFGRKISRLSLEACRFLIEPKKYPKTLIEFQERFNDLNQETNGTVIDLNRAAGFFYFSELNYDCVP